MFHVVDKKRIVCPPPAARWRCSACVPTASVRPSTARSSHVPLALYCLRARAACYVPVVQRKPHSRLVPRTLIRACTSLLSLRMQPSHATHRHLASGVGIGPFHVEHSCKHNRCIYNYCINNNYIYNFNIN